MKRRCSGSRASRLRRCGRCRALSCCSPAMPTCIAGCATSPRRRGSRCLRTRSIRLPTKTGSARRKRSSGRSRSRRISSSCRRGRILRVRMRSSCASTPASRSAPDRIRPRGCACDGFATNLRGGESVLDYGCGSGILAIAAAKLGAARVVGVDVDPQAMRASTANATMNGVDATFAHAGRASAAAASTSWSPTSSPNPLIVLAPALCARVADGGRIALSGILDEQADEVRAAYDPWFTLAAVRATRAGSCSPRASAANDDDTDEWPTSSSRGAPVARPSSA